jgi:hypothetical protein
VRSFCTCRPDQDGDRDTAFSRPKARSLHATRACPIHSRSVQMAAPRSLFVPARREGDTYGPVQRSGPAAARLPPSLGPRLSHAAPFRPDAATLTARPRIEHLLDEYEAFGAFPLAAQAARVVVGEMTDAEIAAVASSHMAAALHRGGPLGGRVSVLEPMLVPVRPLRGGPYPGTSARDARCRAFLDIPRGAGLTQAELACCELASQFAAALIGCALSGSTAFCDAVTSIGGRLE